MVVLKGLRSENMPLKELKEMLAQEEWNVLKRLPVSSWLCERRDDEDKERMKQCGNLVVLCKPRTRGESG